MIRFKIFLLCAILLLTSCSSTRNKSNETDANDPQIKMAEIKLQLGMAYLAKKDFPRAKQNFLTATHGAPKLPEAWYALAYFYEMTGENDLANTYYLKSVELAPKRGDAQNNYGTFLCRRGDFQAAIEHFKTAAADPDYLDIASAYENAGLCALKIPNKPLAKQYFMLAEEKDPMRISTQKALAQLDIDT